MILHKESKTSFFAHCMNLSRMIEGEFIRHEDHTEFAQSEDTECKEWYCATYAIITIEVLTLDKKAIGRLLKLTQV